MAGALGFFHIHMGIVCKSECMYTCVSWSERVSPPLLSQPPVCVIPASCPHNLISLPRSAGTLHARVCTRVCVCPGRWGWCQTESINCSPSVCAPQCVCVCVCELIPYIPALSLFLWIYIHICLCVYICILAFPAFIFQNLYF